MAVVTAFVIHLGSAAGDLMPVRDEGGARLTPGSFETNGAFRLIGLGTNFATYTIFATTNFTNWVTLGDVPADSGGKFLFIDTDRTNYPYRFYRSLGP